MQNRSRLPFANALSKLAAGLAGAACVLSAHAVLAQGYTSTQYSCISPPGSNTNPLSATATVSSWVTSAGTTTPSLFGTNDEMCGAPSPLGASDAGYVSALSTIGTSLYRLLGINIDNWTVNHQWSATADLNAEMNSGYLTAPGAISIVNIASPPSWINGGSQVGLDPNTWGTFCAGLVTLLNGSLGKHVLYWEPMNEWNGSIDGGQMTQGQLDAIYNACATKMKQADGTIKMVGPVYSYLNSGQIQTFLQECNANVDVLSWHHYGECPPGVQSNDTIMNGTPGYGGDVTTAKNLIATYGGGHSIKTALDEYNIPCAWDEGDCRQFNNVGATFNASVLKNLAYAGCDIASNWSAKDDSTYGMIAGPNNPVGAGGNDAIISTGRIHQWANHYLVGTLAPTTSSNGMVEVMAVKQADGSLNVLLINKASGTATVTQNLGLGTSNVSMGSVDGNAPYYHALAPATLGSTITMPPCSVTLIRVAAGGTSGTVSINSGGPAAGSFVADADFSGGSTATNWTGTIDTSGAANPAPQAVYQSERYGANTYTIGGLAANTNYTVRLHFCENFFTASGLRKFNVSINGTSELTNFDIFATAGAAHKAVTQQYTIASNGSGQIVIVYTNVTDNALSNGVEVLAAAPAAPTGLTATAGNTQVSLTWNASTGATAYDVKRSTVSGSGYVTVSSPTVTNYTNTGLTNGTTYYFVVDAKNASGTSANSSQASATPFTVPQAQIASGTPVIDGTVDSIWSTATSYPLNKTFGTVSGSSDCSATWQGLWDATNLYILASVTDDVKKNDSTSPWDDDALEIYLDADHNGGTVYDANDRQIVCGWGDAAAVEPQSRGIAGVAFGKTDPTGTTYIIEAKIPWAIEAFTPAANAIIGIDVHVDDDDDGGANDGKVIWNDGTNQAWTNPSLFGAGKLNAAAGGPPAPTGLTAVQGNAQVALTWNASTGATTYNVYRGTAAGGESTTAIATGIATTNYTNTGLTNGTRYYYTVKAVNSGGTSGASNEANGTPTVPIQINCGGAAAAPYIADADFSGGTTDSAGVGHTITTTGIVNPAPQAVYQYLRWGVFTYTIPGLHVGSNYTVRLHFSENWWTAAGQRVFNVSINSTQVLTNFDVFATAGAQYKAVVKTFTATANASGQVVISTSLGTIDNPIINGIEVY